MGLGARAAPTSPPQNTVSGAADKAVHLQSKLHLDTLLQAADDDAAAYADLQRTWKKDSGLSPDEKKAIEARALAVPVRLLEECHASIEAVQVFLPHCNPNITSDAAVGIHQLAGAARAAYQTAMVNSPPKEEKIRLQGLLKEIRDVEEKLLGLDVETGTDE